MKHIITILMCAIGVATFTTMSLSSCQESFQEKAAREAKDYTRKFCPTPAINCVSTDSVVFDQAKNSFIYYCTFSDKLDDAQVINANEKMIGEVLVKSIKESTQMKQYVEAGCHFHYICRSKKDQGKLLFEVSF